MVNGAPTTRHTLTSVEADAIRAQVRRLSASPQFASAEKLNRFLEFIVEETLENAAVKEYPIGVEVYGRAPDYDPRTDSIVRVEAGKLRARLAQYYEDTGRHDPVRISVPKGGYVPSFEFQESAGAASPLEGRRVRKRFALRFLLTAGLVILPLCAWRLQRYAARTAPRHARLERATTSGQYALDPAVSPDGRLLAYASEEPGTRLLHIRIRELATGEERRLTNYAANDTSPSFSSDGRWVAFRSDRDGGGIYLVPTVGGEPILLVAHGREPQFAPSGLLLAYWVAGDEETGEFGRAFLVDVARQRGPYPRAEAVFGGFSHVRSPVWSDDSRRLLAVGTQQSDVPEREYDAWTIEIEDSHAVGSAVKTGLIPLLKRRGFFETVAERNLVRAGGWADGLLYLTVPHGDQSTVLAAPVSRASGKLRGELRTVLPSTEQLSAPRRAGSGALAFAARRVRYGVWSVAMSSGVATPVTPPGTAIWGISVSRDAGIVVLQTLPAARGQTIRVLDAATGMDRELGRGAVDRPVVSPDGRRVVWRAMDGTRQAIDSAPLADPSNVERLCENCGAPVSWTADGRRILFETGDPNTGIDVLDAEERKRATVLRHPGQSLYGPRFLAGRGSPSDGWLLFYAATGAGTRQIFVAKLRGFRADPEDRWIAVTDGRGLDVEPCWSETGDAVYFITQRGATRSIAGQRVHAITKEPIGKPFIVYTPSSASRTLLSTLPTRRATGLTAAAGRLFFAMDEIESSVWVLGASRQ